MREWWRYLAGKRAFRAFLRRFMLAGMGLLLLLLSAFGCRAPIEEGEPPAGEVPEVPEEILVPEQDEPVLRVYKHETGDVQEMEIEEYLAGVVAGEMSSNWPKEALKAQAVIARSFVLQQISAEGGVPERDAHVSTDIQEFVAFNTDDVNDRIREAINETRGQAVISDGEFIIGWFHAYAGPSTALPDEGIDYDGENPAYFKMVESPARDSIEREEAFWEESFSLEQLRAVVTERTASDPGEITQAAVTETGPSGRAAVVSFDDSEISANDLRRGLDSTVMRSTFIDNLAVEGDNLVISGEGYGHGVGMCQWGARVMAENGQCAEEIINYFFQDVKIKDFW